VSVSQRGLQFGLGIALLGSALLLDPRAEAAFDAAKRACAIVGVIVAALALLCDKSRADRNRWSRPAQVAVCCAALAVVWTLAASILSPHQALAWDSLRRATLFALFIPIGASRTFAACGTRPALGLFVIGASVNVVISLAQAGGWQLPFDVAQIGGRFATGALLGNEGYVALAAATLAAICAAIATGAFGLRYRLGAVGVAAAAVAAIAINHQATSAIALCAGLVAIAAMRWRLRWLGVIFLAIVVGAATTALLPVLRNLTWAELGGIDAYQRLTTYRLGAWVAALHMIATRPLEGYGLGSFAMEQQTHRLAAEISLQQRFVQPTGSSFIYAHNDYLQLAAEAGIPALLFVLIAIAAILFGLVRIGRALADVERLVLLAMLTCAAVAALAWFPLQIPFISIALLLTLGRAWRVVADEGAP